MNEALLKYLKSIGLKADATNDEALAFYGELEGEQRETAKGLRRGDNTPEPEPKVDPEPTPEPQTGELAEIRAIAEMSGLDSDWTVKQLEQGATIAEAKEAALAVVRARREAADVGTGSGGDGIRVGEDRNLSTIGPAIADAIIGRANGVSLTAENVGAPHERASEFAGLSMIELMKVHLDALGVDGALTMRKHEVVELLSPSQFRRRQPRAYALAQSSSDFSNILVDAMEKSLRAAYLDAPNTWSMWARRVTAPDFKTIHRAALSESPDLTASDPDGGEVVYVTLSDTKETYALQDYKGGLMLTRKAMINDDLDAFGRIPMLHAAAARRKEEDVAYAILTANANMADGTALFASGHSNVVASGSGGAPSVAQLEDTEVLLLNAKGPKDAAFLQLEGKYLLVPTALKATAQQVLNSTVDPAKSNSTNNPYNGKFEVVPSARLNADSSSKWYLLADYRTGQVDTVEVAFLEGEEEPTLSRETDFDTDDVKFKVRHTVAAQAIDHRGMARNFGA